MNRKLRFWLFVAIVTLYGFGVLHFPDEILRFILSVPF